MCFCHIKVELGINDINFYYYIFDIAIYFEEYFFIEKEIGYSIYYFGNKTDYKDEFHALLNTIYIKGK